MSTTVDVSDSLDEARTRLLKTARALNGAWAAALCSMVLLVVGSFALLVFAVTDPAGVRHHLVGAAGSDRHNLTRFCRAAGRALACCSASRRPTPCATPSTRKAGWPGLTWSGWCRGPSSSWPRASWCSGCPCLPVSTRPSCGLLLVAACSRRSRTSARCGGRSGSPTAKSAGRWWAAGSPGSTPRLTEGLRARAAQLDADLGNWAGACERAAFDSSRRTAVVMSSRDQIVEAWTLIRNEWLKPAFARGRRHVTPFTGLRQFVEAADAAGWLKHPRPWWPPTGAMAGIVGAHEEALALELRRARRPAGAGHVGPAPARGHRAAMARLGHRGARRRAADDYMRPRSAFHAR